MLAHFSNGRYAFTAGDRISLPVEAVKRSVHGDWKTNIATGCCPAIEVGQTAVVVSIWTNFEGTWCTIKLDGMSIDVSPQDLKML